MKIRLLALSAIAGLCACTMNAASLPARANAEPPLAIYYSFESLPPGTLMNEMQSELARILAPAGLDVAWRQLEHPSATESFREVVILRFRGSCSLNPETALDHNGPDPAGNPLAETELADGRVLPFGEVECDQLRRYIAPAADISDAERGNQALGKAIARVAAHEIYHMLTGSGAHARSGIARAAHSRSELTATTFDFAQNDTAWLRGWVERSREPQPTLLAHEAAAEAGSGSEESDAAVAGSR